MSPNARGAATRPPATSARNEARVTRSRSCHVYRRSARRTSAHAHRLGERAVGQRALELPCRARSRAGERLTAAAWRPSTVWIAEHRGEQVAVLDAVELAEVRRRRRGSRASRPLRRTSCGPAAKTSPKSVDGRLAAVAARSRRAQRSSTSTCARSLRAICVGQLARADLAQRAALADLLPERDLDALDAQQEAHDLEVGGGARLARLARRRRRRRSRRRRRRRRPRARKPLRVGIDARIVASGPDLRVRDGLGGPRGVADHQLALDRARLLARRPALPRAVLAQLPGVRVVGQRALEDVEQVGLAARGPRPARRARRACRGCAA